jgi:chromate transporter
MRLKEVALLFLQLGTTAFGGPAAYVAMMQDEVVRRRHWLTDAEFLDRLSASNLIPGPTATELAVHIGYRQAGVAGLLLGGMCFIVPAALISLLLAWAYVRFGTLPQVAGLLYGVKPVIIAVVVEALWKLGRVAVKTPLLGAVAVLAVAASATGMNPLLVLLAAGILVAAAHVITERKSAMPSFLAAVTPGSLAGTATTAAAAVMVAPFSLKALFLFFLKIGAVIFGSGYVLLAFLEADLVDHWHWLTHKQLLDAVAVGQVTPGPVFSTATFIGYVLGGVPGAVVATLGIFLPAFVLVTMSGPIISRVRRSAVAGAFLDGVNAGSLALMAAVTWILARTAIVDVSSAGLAVVGAFLLLRFRVNSAWLVLGGALFGLAITSVLGT